MSETVVARRYAQALLLADGGTDPSVRAAFESIVESYRSAGELREALQSPRVSTDEKLRVLRRLAPSAPAVLDNFLRLLLEHRREGELEHAYEEYCRISDLGSGELEAVVETALPLTAEQEKQMLPALERRFGQKLRLTLRTVPGLLGGVRVTVGDRLLDDSVVARLARVRRKLTAQSELGGKS